MTQNPLKGWTIDPESIQGNPEAIMRIAGTTPPELMGQRKDSIAPLMAIITFSGAALPTGDLGSLAGTKLASFRCPLAGLLPAHWRSP